LINAHPSSQNGCQQLPRDLIFDVGIFQGGSGPGGGYTEAELAKALGKSPQTVGRLRKKRAGPAFWMNGKSPIYPPAMIRAWVRSRIVQPIRRKG
jgi:hypothetical protein